MYSYSIFLQVVDTEIDGTSNKWNSNYSNVNNWNSTHRSWLN